MNEISTYNTKNRQRSNQANYTNNKYINTWGAYTPYRITPW